MYKALFWICWLALLTWNPITAAGVLLFWFVAWLTVRQRNKEK